MTETKSVGYWGSVWRKFKKDRLAFSALIVILLLLFVAVFESMLAGNKPIVLKYEGHLYFPVLFRYDPG